MFMELSQIDEHVYNDNQMVISEGSKSHYKYL